MDWSDENYALNTGDCITQPLVMFHDDHKCREDFWSCGDGEYVLYFNRYVYQTLYVGTTNCFSRQEFNHMCELVANLSPYV